MVDHHIKKRQNSMHEEILATINTILANAQRKPAPMKKKAATNPILFSAGMGLMTGPKKYLKPYGSK